MAAVVLASPGLTEWGAVCWGQQQRPGGVSGCWGLGVPAGPVIVWARAHTINSLHGTLTMRATDTQVFMRRVPF